MSDKGHIPVLGHQLLVLGFSGAGAATSPWCHAQWAALSVGPLVDLDVHFTCFPNNLLSS